MNFFQGVNPLEMLRQRIMGVIGVIVTALAMLVCGGVLAFVVSPGQAMEWRRIQGLPETTSMSLGAAPSGEAVVFTGTLDGNEELTDYRLVAYSQSIWEVSSSTDQDGNTEYDGSWTEQEKVVPALTVRVSDGVITTIPETTASFGRPTVTETIESAQGRSADGHNEGSLQYTGFRNGDLVTVTGTRTSGGKVLPDRIFGGAREQLVADIRSGAKAAFAGGIGMMICSPVVLVGGIIAVIFGRARRR